MEIFSSFECGDMLLLYCREGNLLDLALIPSDMKDKIVLAGKNPESMIQFKLSGTSSGRAPGISMRNAPCIQELHFLSQEKIENQIVTHFEYGGGLFFDHIVELHDGWIRVWTDVHNRTAKGVKFDYLAAFSLGMLSPFQKDDGAGKYFIERVQSQGHHEELSVERAGLERRKNHVGSLRFGQNSTMPVTQYYPFAGLEDRDQGVLWGVQLEACGAWQLEISRIENSLNFSGGTPDRESGGWIMQLPPGKIRQTMSAVLTCVKGDILDLFNRLHFSRRSNQKPNGSLVYCGSFSAKKLQSVKELGIKYYVLDTDFSEANAVSTLEQIRQSGLIPGITLEFETLPMDSETARNHPEMLLSLDGKPIQTDSKVFINLCHEKIREDIFQKLVNALGNNKIGYLKLHCSAAFSCGCDGDNTPLENQQQYTDAVHAFYKDIRQAIPGLVVEISAPGGSRFSAGWMRMADIGSSSDMIPDAEIPMVALDRQMLVPSNKCAVNIRLQPGEDTEMLRYKLTGALLGRMCLTGDFSTLSENELLLLKEGINFHRSAESVIENGIFRLGHIIGDVRSDPTGWQVFHKNGENMQLVVVHTFRNAPQKLSFELMPGMKLTKEFVSKSLSYEIRDGILEIDHIDDFKSAAFLLKH